MNHFPKLLAKRVLISQKAAHVHSFASKLKTPESYASFLKNWRSTDVTSKVHRFEDQLMEPLTYNMKNAAPLTKTLMVAFNHWLQIPEEKFNRFAELMVQLQENALLIDDIMDKSSLRRGKPTSHIVHGFVPTLNCAAYNYYRIQDKYFKAVNYDPELVKWWTKTLMNIYEAEGVERIWTRDSYCPSENEFIVNMMTKIAGYSGIFANLMQSASQNKVNLSPLTELLSGYGQLRDDYECLFYPDEKYKDKEVFAEDLSTGRYTLAMVHAIRIKKNKEVERILKSKPKDEATKKRCVEILKDIGTMDYCKQVLMECDEAVLNEMKKIGPNHILEHALESLRDWQDPTTRENADCFV